MIVSDKLEKLKDGYTRMISMICDVKVLRFLGVNRSQRYGKIMCVRCNGHNMEFVFKVIEFLQLLSLFDEIKLSQFSNRSQQIIHKVMMIKQTELTR